MSEASGSTEQERLLGAGLGRDHHPVFARFRPWTGTVAAGWDTNFLGVKTRVTYFSMFERLADFSEDRELQTQVPIHNEDYFEWVDLLESVVGANDCFRMIELGAGWGKWIANGARAAHSIGLEAHVTGVEAEPTHYRWMKEHLRDNGIDDNCATLVRAAVAAEDGRVSFHVGAPADWYGQRIEESPAPAMPGARWNPLRTLRKGTKRGMERVHAVSLCTLLAGDEVVDLIDSDVQGSEAEVFEAAGGRLSEVVRRVHIGTHSHENEQRLRTLFDRLGWKNVNDFPTGQVNETPYGPMPFEDGVQTWVNLELCKISPSG